MSDETSESAKMESANKDTEISDLLDDLPETGPVGDAQSKNHNHFWDEETMEYLEKIGGLDCYTGLEHKALEDQINDYIKNHPSEDAPTLGEKVRALFRLIKEVPKNAIGQTIKKNSVQRNNAKTLANLQEGDKVIVFMHGYKQNEGVQWNWIKDAESQGYKAIALGWDYTDFNDGGLKATNLAREILHKTHNKASIVGHSDGCKAVLAGSFEFGLDQYAKDFLFVQGPINNQYQNLPGHLAIGGLPASGNLATKEGKDNALYNNLREPECPVYTITGTSGPTSRLANVDDGLVSRRATALPYATEKSFAASHFDAAGTEQNTNRAINKHAKSLGEYNQGDAYARLYDRTSNKNTIAEFTKSKRNPNTPHGEWYKSA